MNIKSLKDSELLTQTKEFVQKERQVLTRVLHLLREVERRKLFCDLGYRSLFEYAVKELRYSEGQAGRRIQAMRLIKELPQIENKIKSGSLSLSNISQAQSYFREAAKIEPQNKIPTEEKLKVMEKLENKSAREGQKYLIQMQPQGVLPKEREKILTDELSELSFIANSELKNKLGELRSLLGAKASSMSLAELVAYMADVSIESVKIKKFGKKRVLNKSPESLKNISNCGKSLENTSDYRKTLKSPSDCKKTLKDTTNSKSISKKTTFGKINGKPLNTPTSELKANLNNTKTNNAKPNNTYPHNTKPRNANSPNSRYISKAVKYQVWQRDQGKCRNCGSFDNLNIDHIKAFALGGMSTVDNLRLLCFHCNQRQAMKTFGLGKIEEKQMSFT